jgi:hypothetical protein
LGAVIWSEVADGTMNADIYREEAMEIAEQAMHCVLDEVALTESK